MLEIIGLIIGIYLSLLIMGYGIFSFLIKDEKIKPYAVFISPWFGICAIALGGVWLSMMGLAMNIAAWTILVLGGSLSLYAFIKRHVLNINYLETILLFLFLMIGLGVSLFPLAKQVGFATTISLSNLDPISYSTVADYLIDETVFSDSSYLPFSPFSWSVGDLIHHSYRWGSPILLSFISALFNLPAFKVYSILISFLFATSFPLIYILAKYLFSKLTHLSILIIFLLYSINSTLLYMLYNVFFAQFVFSGVFITSIILFLVYTKQQKFISWKINPLDIALALLLSATSSLYPEGLFLISLPIFTWICLKIIKNKNLIYLKTLKVFILGILLNPYTMFTAIRQLSKVVVSSSRTTFIGWEMIRAANPMELLGLYNLHYSRPIPITIMISFSLILIVIWLIGFIKIKQKLVISSYLIVFFITYFFTKVVGNNFFTYHRSLTYSLFIYVIFFTIAIDSILKLSKSFKIKSVCILILVGLSLRSAHRTTHQLYWHHEVIDKSLISLRDLNKEDINQPFYTADVFLGEYNLWRRLWQEYFLTNQKIISRQNINIDNKLITKPLPVLAEKQVLEKNEVKLVYESRIWENEYYILGYLNPELYED